MVAIQVLRRMELPAIKRLGIALLLLLVSASLYVPWRHNPLVFDDGNILKSTTLFDYAQRPFSLSPRQFPYFTLGFESVLSGGNTQVSRLVALALHACNGYLLYLLGQRLLAKTLPERRARMLALAMALVFVVHPVAVYAVGYLAQRTVLFATFFLLLSALKLERAWAAASWRRALLAGLCCGLALMCKEHALTGLLGVSGLLLFRQPTSGAGRGRVVVAFWGAALPFALWIAFLKLGFVGVAYEPDAQVLISAVGFPDKGSALGNWVLSASLQCLFFFRYLGVWCWPNPSGLAIDIRPDFEALSNSYWIVVGPLGFIALVATLAFALLSRRSRPEIKLIAFGMLWATSLFLIELSTVRFQEAIVLYRSYLWAPGFLLAIAGAMSLLGARTALVVASLALCMAAPLAWGRLHTFSDELLLWQEAAQKMPQPNSPGAIRIHYNLGVFYAQAGQIDAALKEFDWVISQDGNAFHGYWGRSAVYMRRGEWPQAANDLETVIAMKPDFGMAYLQYAAVLKSLGKRQASQAAVAQSEKLGIAHIDFK